MYSELVVPKPHDWPSQVFVTGYWALPVQPDYEPHKDLSKFLKGGDPPVYIGFGSMPIHNHDEFLNHVINALQQLNLRGIICGNFLFSVKIPETILLLKEAPHEWLFPRCSVAVHHGGAGTAGSSFRAGIPTVIFPLIGDQEFWGTRASILGVGPKEIIPLKDLNEKNLANQIKEVLQPDIKQKSEELGKKLRAENGIMNATKIFEENFITRQNSGITTNWKDDKDAPFCGTCKRPWTLFNRRHHCRSCGGIFCVECMALCNLPNYGDTMVCEKCFASRQRLAIEASSILRKLKEDH